MNNLNWNAPEQMRAYCQKVLPLVYDESLSYYEVLCKLQFKVNELIENTENLPQYIYDLVQAFFKSEDFDTVLRELLSGFMLNVKYPPAGIPAAIGDGVADDTLSLQGCIDFAKTKGLLVYLPSGVYLTQSLTLYDKVSLNGDSRYNTRLVLRGGATAPLVNGISNNNQISNIMLDGNGANQINDITLVKLEGCNYLLSNLIVVDGTENIRIIANNGHIQINNIIFNRASACCLIINKKDNNQNEIALNIDTLQFNTLSSINAAAALITNIDGAIINNIYSYVKSMYAFILNGDNITLSAQVFNATNAYLDGGVNNQINIISKTKKQNVESYELNSSEINIVNDNITIDNKTITIDNDNFVLENSDSVIVNTPNIKIEGESFNAVNKDFIINSENPLTYKTPTDINIYFKSIPAKDTAGDEYQILVRGDNDFLFKNTPANVKDYGAKGDGVTDDTAVIKFCLAENDTVYFPYGTYLISDTLKLRTKQKVYGDTLKATTIKPFSNTVLLDRPLISGEITSITAAETIVQENIHIEHLNFEYDYFRSEYPAIFININNLIISECTFTALNPVTTNYKDGIYINKTNAAISEVAYAHITNNIFNNTRINIQNISFAMINNNIFSGTNILYSIFCENTRNIIISNNNFTLRILLKSCSMYKVSNNNFTYNAIVSPVMSSTSIELQGVNTYGEISNNSFFSMPGCPILCQGNAGENIIGLNITNNYFYNCDIYAVGVPDVFIACSDIVYPTVICSNNIHSRDIYVKVVGETKTIVPRTGAEAKGATCVIRSSGGGSSFSYSVLSNVIALFPHNYLPMIKESGTIYRDCYPTVLFPLT